MINMKYLKQPTVLLSLVGCLLLILGNFVPLVHIQSDTLEYIRDINFIDFEGKYIVITAILAIILIILEEPKYACLPLLVSTFFLGYLLINKSDLYSDCSFYESMFSWGIGLYIILIGNILSYVNPVQVLIKNKFDIRLRKRK